MYTSYMCLCDINKQRGSLRLVPLPDSSILIDSTLYLSSGTSVKHVFVSSQETGRSEAAELLGCETVRRMPDWRDLAFRAAA